MSHINTKEKTSSHFNHTSPDQIKADIQRHLRYTLADFPNDNTYYDKYLAVVYTLLERVHHYWIETQEAYINNNIKRVYYLSLEYLMGQLLDNILLNMGLSNVVKHALSELNIEYERIKNMEPDAGLGNGGLGRLAACFLDSMASMGIPAVCYGIRYDYGIFEQKIERGYQIETPDKWLDNGDNPWDQRRFKLTYPVQFYGNTQAYQSSDGQHYHKWINTQNVLAVAYDTFIPGYKNNIVNHLRLWKTTGTESIDLHSFNQGDYIKAMQENILKENISYILYPNDRVFQGQELRLKQEYLLAAASLRDIFRRFKLNNSDLRKLPEKIVVHCNDTHPNMAIPEMMRIFLDEEKLPWNLSWEITSKCFVYTNHTLMPEALEKWPIHLMEQLLPRHTEIIYEINRRFLDKIDIKTLENPDDKNDMSIIRFDGQPTISMAHLGIVGSYKVNGVSALHSKLLKDTFFKSFSHIYPDRFINVTNGVSPRRWLMSCNPQLAALITESIGNTWQQNLEHLNQLEKFADDSVFQDKFRTIKTHNKRVFVEYLYDKFQLSLPTNMFYDMQIKRIHEYKRQLLVVLYICYLYNKLKENPKLDIIPQIFFFAGKAAPGYDMAKLHIKLINEVSRTINEDPLVSRKLRCYFLPNYCVSMAEKMIPAADISEQVSTAGMEASGTGNMKFALNGALIVGTMDGANIEIQSHIGKENIYTFGLDVDEIKKIRSQGYYSINIYHNNKDLKQVIDQIKNGYYCPSNPDLFHPITNNLLHHNDYFMVMADFEAYVNIQNQIRKDYKNTQLWTHKAIMNVARMGWFSSDRSIRDYAKKAWGIKVQNQDL